MSKGKNEHVDLEGWISRVARCLIRLSRRVTEHGDKTDYQMTLIYELLQTQKAMIDELASRLEFLESKDCGIPRIGAEVGASKCCGGHYPPPTLDTSKTVTGSTWGNLA